MHQSPIACQLNALSNDERMRRSELASGFSKSIQEVQELPNGFAIRFSADARDWMRAAEFVALERRCCPFLAFSLEAQEEDGPFWIRITGRDGVKAFIAAELGIHFLK